MTSTRNNPVNVCIVYNIFVKQSQGQIACEVCFLNFFPKVRVGRKKEVLFLFQVEGRKISVTHFLPLLSFLWPFELYQRDISAAIEAWKPIFIDYFIHQLTHYGVNLNYIKVAVDITCKEFS